MTHKKHKGHITCFIRNSWLEFQLTLSSSTALLLFLRLFIMFCYMFVFRCTLPYNSFIHAFIASLQ